MKRTYASIDKDIETPDEKGDKNEFETDIRIKVTKNDTRSFIHDDNSNNQSLEIIPYVYSPIRDYYSSDDDNSNLGENEENHCKSVVNDDNNKELNIGNNSNFESNNDNESSASNELYTIDLTNIEDVIAENNIFLENLTSNNRPENSFTVIKTEFQENYTFNENTCNTNIPQMTVSGTSLQNTETKLPLSNLTVETQISSHSSKLQLKPSRIYQDCEEQNNNDEEISRDTRETSRVLQNPSEVYEESSQDHQEQFNNENIPNNVQQETRRFHPNLNEVFQEPSQSHQTIQQEQSVIHQETSRLPQESSIVQQEQLIISWGPSQEYQEQSNIQQVISRFPQGNDEMSVSCSSLQNTETKLPLNNLTVETQISSPSSKIQLKPSRIYLDCEKQNNIDEEISRDTRETSRVLQKPSEVYEQSSQNHQEQFNNEKIPNNVQQETPRFHSNLNEVIQEPSQSQQTIQQEQYVVHQETSRLPQESSIVQQEQSNIQQVISRFPQGNEEFHQKSPKVHNESSIVYQGKTSTFNIPANVHQKPSNQQETSNIYHVLSGSHQGASRALQELSKLQSDFPFFNQESNMGYQKPSNSQHTSIVYQSPSIIHEKTPRVAPIIYRNHPTNKVHQVPQDSPSVSQKPSMVPQEASRLRQVLNRIGRPNNSYQISRDHSESSFNHQKSRICSDKSPGEISTFPQELFRGYQNPKKNIDHEPIRNHELPSRMPQEYFTGNQKPFVVHQKPPNIQQSSIVYQAPRSTSQNMPRNPQIISRIHQTNKVRQVPQDTSWIPPSRFHQDQSRFIQDLSRVPQAQCRVAQDQSRYPQDQSRVLQNQSRFPQYQTRFPQYQTRFPQYQTSVPQTLSRVPQNLPSTSTQTTNVSVDLQSNSNTESLSSPIQPNNLHTELSELKGFVIPILQNVLSQQNKISITLNPELSNLRNISTDQTTTPINIQSLFNISINCDKTDPNSTRDNTENNLQGPSNATSTKQKKKFFDLNSRNCTICMDPLGQKPIASTTCGHIFCLPCIQETFNTSPKKCPTCRKKFTDVGYHQIFL